MQRVNSPDTSDTGIENQIVAKGLTAPRVTPADLENNVLSEHFFTAATAVYGSPNTVGFTRVDGKYKPVFEDQTHQALSLLTFCVIVLRNGFTVTGESACASPENFDAEIGRQIARTNAVNKIWPLMGYALKEQLSKAQP